ncbi:MAG: UDPGP type 1 family protein, partial [Lachnospiraceae bacterium]|nr:UDPGP type 1 family protein [Lachnospiraceae bacterium]
MIPESITKKLSEYGQEHVLRYFDELSEGEKAGLLSQIESTDMSILSAVNSPETLNAKGKITPLKCMELGEIEAGKETYTKTGLDAIKAGKVGAVLLAGGMGTRLGSDNPKGMYNVGLTRELYIFECLINNLMDV